MFNKKNCEGLSLNVQMISAIFEDSPQKIKELVDLGFDINDCTTIVMPPLHRAALYGKTEAVKMLLSLGANKNLKDKDSKTALYWATKRNHTDIISLLEGNLSKGKDIM